MAPRRLLSGPRCAVTPGHLAVWADTSGFLVKDGGEPLPMLEQLTALLAQMTALIETQKQTNELLYYVLKELERLERPANVT